DVLLNPDRTHVEDLTVGDGLEDRDNHDGDESNDDAPLGCSESRSALVLAPFHARRQVAISVEIGGQAKKHEDRGDAEAIVPAVNLCDQTAKQGSNDRSDVDCSREDDEAAGSPRCIL